MKYYVILLLTSCDSWQRHPNEERKDPSGKIKTRNSQTWQSWLTMRNAAHFQL